MAKRLLSVRLPEKDAGFLESLLTGPRPIEFRFEEEGKKPVYFFGFLRGGEPGWLGVRLKITMTGRPWEGEADG